jgi:ParB-like nuclease family protein
VQFDRVASDDPSTVSTNPFVEPELIAEDHEDPSPPRGREGLPPAFRMRHGRHYVEQLMGDAPLRTVREISVAEIDAVSGPSTDLRELEHSIRELGVLEPLLVAPRNGRYEVIAGASRLRAAAAVGLRTVPCLVHDVDDEGLASLREAARRRADSAETLPEPLAEAVPSTTGLPAGLAELTKGLGFIGTLVPALQASVGDPFRSTVLADLIAVELQRGKTVAAAGEIAAGPVSLTPSRVECSALIARTVAAVREEARLRDVAFQIEALDAEYHLEADEHVLSVALESLLRGMVTLVTGQGATLRISVQGTLVRPALIVQIAQDVKGLAPETVARFFDAGWADHPCGVSGAVMLACAAAAARLHRGRAGMRLTSTGSLVTFVVPRVVAGC